MRERTGGSSMNDKRAFEEWASDPARRPVALSLARMLVEENVGGVGRLVEVFRENGSGKKVDAWIHAGEAVPRTPEEVERAFGGEALDDLAVDAGMYLDETREALT